VTGTLSLSGLLLLAAVAWPVALSLLWLLRAFRRHASPLVATLALPALLLAFTGDSTLQLSIPGLYTSMQLGLDAIGRPFVLLTALLWSVVAVHAHTYVSTDPRRGAFMGFLVAAGTGNIGLTVAQDMLSFYLFFALMTFAAYGLVVHTRTAAALRAGRVYIAMAVLGETLIIAGLFTVTAFADNAAFEHVPASFAAMPHPGAVAALIVVGFGVKAGLVPVHLWLPLAHPVAPTPASALLSGAMIKAGILGWLRFLPIGHMPFESIGMAVMAAGVAATVLAAAVGITQRDVKTVLAYSSISQVGFMAVGIGAALVLPDAAPLLVLAVAVYALHHAPAKAALFLSVGLVHAGRRRLLAVAALPALVLAGAPLTSGAVAKSALKHALGDVPPPWPVPIDVLLSVAAIGTTLLMARSLALLALAEPDADRALPRAGLLLPWLLLALSSAIAAVWLPLTVAPLGELPLATDPAYIAAALWPIALGILAAAATAWLARRYPVLTVPGVPAGDIVAFVEAAGAAVTRATRPMRSISLEESGRRGGERIEREAGRIIDGSSVLMERMAAGPALGITFCIIAALLFLLLR
jgi:formate hydrogenlyase subunit 3/multisubunit Na+/H+ antiporter MnhD subunit